MIYVVIQHKGTPTDEICCYTTQRKHTDEICCYTAQSKRHTGEI